MKPQAIHQTQNEQASTFFNPQQAAANDQHLHLEAVIPLEYRLPQDRIHLDRVRQQVGQAKAQLVRQCWARLRGR